MAIKIDNKDVIQSYLVTTAKYDFSVYEKRILYRLVEMVQSDLEGKKLLPGYCIEKSFLDDRIITMPLTAFLTDEKDENYSRIKTALKELRGKSFEYEDHKIWKLIGIIEKPTFYKSGFVRFEVQPEIYNAILDFSKGFRKYELKTAMSFESQYAMRFYELFSNQKTPLTYSIDNLKIMFSLEKRYKLTADFIRYVIVPAKNELDKKAPYSFNYIPLKTGRSITAVKFIPYYIPTNRDQDLEKANLQKQVNLSWDLDPMVREYLKQNFLYSSEELKNNIDLFKEAQKEIPDLMLVLSMLKGKSRDKDNVKGYVINALKGKLKDIASEKKSGKK